VSKEYFEGRGVDEEEQQDRARYWLNLLKIIACVACALYLLKLAIPNAHAQEALTMSVTGPGGNLVRLTTEPCEGAPAWLGLFKAEMHYRGRRLPRLLARGGGGSAGLR
jgi:hypothetical protein